MRERLGEGDADKAAILGAHAEILADPALDEMVSGLIRDEYYNANGRLTVHFPSLSRC